MWHLCGSACCSLITTSVSACADGKGSGVFLEGRDGTSIPVEMSPVPHFTGQGAAPDPAAPLCHAWRSELPCLSSRFHGAEISRVSGDARDEPVVMGPSSLRSRQGHLLQEEWLLPARHGPVVTCSRGAGCSGGVPQLGQQCLNPWGCPRSGSGAREHGERGRQKCSEWGKAQGLWECACMRVGKASRDLRRWQSGGASPTEGGEAPANRVITCQALRGWVRLSVLQTQPHAIGCS